MDNNLIKVCYEGNEGISDIKTIKEGDVLYVSLIDVQNALNKENRSINESHVAKSIVGIIKGLLNELDKDEYLYITNDKMTHLDNKEMFVTQPGLFRVLSHDKSNAGKRFQRWLFHEVVPSITKYGTYPPPLIHQDSDVMKIAKTLVMEIEQREKLERETKERFARHEKAIQTLSSKVKGIEGNTSGIEFMSVKEFCEESEFKSLDQQLVFGWCIKICTENSEPTTKLWVDGEQVLHFPIHVINEAVSNIYSG